MKTLWWSEGTGCFPISFTSLPGVAFLMPDFPPPAAVIVSDLRFSSLFHFLLSTTALLENPKCFLTFDFPKFDKDKIFLLFLRIEIWLRFLPVVLAIWRLILKQAKSSVFFTLFCRYTFSNAETVHYYSQMYFISLKPSFRFICYGRAFKIFLRATDNNSFSFLKYPFEECTML